MIGDPSPIQRVFSTILWNTIQVGANKFRVDPRERGSLIQIFKDEAWQNLFKLPAYVHAPLIEHAKSLASIDPDEISLAVSGVAQVHLRDEANFLNWDFNLRISLEPTQWGQHLVVAIEKPDLGEIHEATPSLDDIPPFSLN